MGEQQVFLISVVFSQENCNGSLIQAARDGSVLGSESCRPTAFAVRAEANKVEKSASMTEPLASMRAGRQSSWTRQRLACI